ncbi:hypothetical protein IWW39_000468 [Coemansia spiralis]|uniref:Ubiquitin-like domain-containing protein n=1 Tax=Coemansia spiralis TaxID=417178 RepID=A0A9W8L765_9FUNG|nr:hypothetical protein IWW39_000468 [Coemansia spiralis]
MPAIQSMILPPEEREDYFSLTFKTLKAPVQKFTLHTSSVRTVAQVKRHLARVSNIPVANMRLVLGGKGLVDTKLIGDYSIPEDAVIQIISKPPVAGEAAMAEVPAAASDANPLSSVLNQESKEEVTKEEAAMSTSDKTDSSGSDDGEHRAPEDLTEETMKELGDSESAFRTKLRELVHSHFGKGQGEAVNSALGKTFGSLAK